jgi:hypothetical protein
MLQDRRLRDQDRARRLWIHPYDVAGKRRGFSALPSRLQDLRDDPCRSLAGEVRQAGGFAKDISPYVEFLWADYFRRKVPRAMVGKRLRTGHRDCYEDRAQAGRTLSAGLGRHHQECLTYSASG